MVQALILAAGRGSRMKHLTDQHPKCLVKMGGKSLLEWQTEALKTAGIKKIHLATGYCADELKKTGYPCFFNPLWMETNMVETLCCANELLMEDEIIISYSDIVFNPSIISSLLKASSPLSITYDTRWRTLWQMRFINPLEDAESFRLEGEWVKEIGKKTQSLDEIEGQFMGLLKISPVGWKILYQYLSALSSERKGNMQTTELLQYLIESGIPVQAISVCGKWCEVDSPEDLALYGKKLKTNNAWDHDWRN